MDYIGGEEEGGGGMILPLQLADIYLIVLL